MNLLKELCRNRRVGSHVTKKPIFRAISSKGCLRERGIGISKSYELRELSGGTDGKTYHTRQEPAAVAVAVAVGKCKKSSRPPKNCMKSRRNRLDGGIGEEAFYRDNVRQREISWRNFESNGFYKMMKESATLANYVVPSVLSRETITSLCLEKQVDKDKDKEVELLDESWWNGQLEQITKNLNYICPFGEKGLIKTEKDLVRGICIKLGSGPDEKRCSIQFLCALTYLDDIIFKESELYPTFSRALNTYCQALLPDLSTNEIFQVFHSYRLIGNPAIHWQGSFPQCALSVLGQRMDTFNSSQMLQLCYFIAVCRKAIGDMTKLQLQIEKHIGNMRVGELALVISAFFKTNVPIVDSQILSTLVYKAKQSRKSIDPLYFATILKSLRFHQGALKQPTILMLFLEFMHLDTLAIEAFSHLLHYATAHLIYQEVLMQQIRNRVADERIKSARLKDIIKLLMYVSRIGYFSQHADAICNTVMDHLKSTYRTSRDREIKRYPFAFVNCIAHLSSMNKYDPELLEVALNQRLLGRLDFDQGAWWEVWFLDRSVLIDFPEYKYNGLPQNYHQQLANLSVAGLADANATTQHQRVHHFEQILSSVAFTLKNMFDCTSCVLVGRVLPQYSQQNVIICLDKATGRGVPIRSDFLPESLIQPRFPSGTDDANWLAFELVPETRVILGTSEAYGLHQTKLRHLRSLGYIPYTIMEPDWSKHVTEAERFSYLAKLIST